MFPCYKMKLNARVSEAGEEFNEKRIEGSLKWSQEYDPSSYYKFTWNLLNT